MNRTNLGVQAMLSTLDQCQVRHSNKKSRDSLLFQQPQSNAPKVGKRETGNHKKAQKPQEAQEERERVYSVEILFFSFCLSRLSLSLLSFLCSLCLL